MAPSKAKKVTLTSKKRPNAKRSVRQQKGKRKTLELEEARSEDSDRSADSTLSRHVDTANCGEGTESEVAAMRAELEEQRLQNAELRKQIENMAADRGQHAGTQSVPRPQGTAGTNFSIQEAMGLAGSAKKYETYKAIQRNLRDLAMNARINWEVPWAQVPARDKAKLFEVARDQHPFLTRFERDWATEEIVKQFIKNRRKNHYANGWLEVPGKYAYLKQNAMKRNQTASRSKRALAKGVESSSTEPTAGPSSQLG